MTRPPASGPEVLVRVRGRDILLAAWLPESRQGSNSIYIMCVFVPGSGFGKLGALENTTCKV